MGGSAVCMYEPYYKQTPTSKQQKVKASGQAKMRKNRAEERKRKVCNMT